MKREKTERIECCVCGKKSAFVVEEEPLNIEGELYSFFCPSVNMANMEAGLIQRCPFCGYENLRIDESMGITKEMVQSPFYTVPFGEEEKVDARAVSAFRVGLAFKLIKSYKTAARFFIISTALVNENSLNARKLCLRNALTCLTRLPLIFDVLCAQINTMRQLKMFESVIELAEEGGEMYTGIERQVIERIKILAKLQNFDYKTYIEMLEDEMVLEEKSEA